MQVLENRLTEIGNKTFHEVFKSMQLLGFGVLYYNFNFGEEALIEFNRLLHENNNWCLDNFDNYIETEKKIEKISGWTVHHVTKEFPYRARVGMMGGLPKKVRGTQGLQTFNMANLQSFSAIESYLVLTMSVLMNDKYGKDGKKLWSAFGKTQMLSWWEHMKEEAMNYAVGMNDSFLVNYMFDQLGVQLVEGDSRND